MSANGWSAFGSLCFLCAWVSALWQMAANDIAEWRQWQAAFDADVADSKARYERIMGRRAT